MIWEFTFNNGYEGVTTITSELLDTEERARQRAISEFVQGGTKKKYIEFTTYRTDLLVGDHIEMGGLVYRLTNVDVRVSEKAAVSICKGVYYGT